MGKDLIFPLTIRMVCITSDNVKGLGQERDPAKGIVFCRLVKDPFGPVDPGTDLGTLQFLKIDIGQAGITTEKKNIPYLAGAGR